MFYSSFRTPLRCIPTNTRLTHYKTNPWPRKLAYLTKATVSISRLHGEIAGAVAGVVGRGLGPAQHVDLDAAKVGKRCPVQRVVGQQVLGAQLVADLLEGFVELSHRGGIVILAAG